MESLLDMQFGVDKMVQNCPKCDTPLKRDTAVKQVGDGYKIIGYYRFCPNRDCDFETEITKKD